MTATMTDSEVEAIYNNVSAQTLERMKRMPIQIKRQVIDGTLNLYDLAMHIWHDTVYLLGYLAVIPFAIITRMAREFAEGFTSGMSASWAAFS